MKPASPLPPARPSARSKAARPGFPKSPKKHRASASPKPGRYSSVLSPAAWPRLVVPIWLQLGLLFLLLGDPNGHTTAMAYDNLQRVTTITDALSHVTQFTYGANSGGNAFDSSSFKSTHTVDPRGFTADVTYDALYRPVTKSAQYDTAQSPAATSTIYDAVGNPLTVTDPLGHQTRSTYDALNRPLVVTNADGTTSQMAYTSTGFKWQMTDPNSHVSQTQYDAAGRATVVTQAVGTSVAATSQTIYDGAGNAAETINPLGQKWDYVFDARNRKVQEFEPSVTDASTSTASRPAMEWQYDAGGRVTATIDARQRDRQQSSSTAAIMNNMLTSFNCGRVLTFA